MKTFATLLWIFFTCCQAYAQPAALNVLPDRIPRKVLIIYSAENKTAPQLISDLPATGTILEYMGYLPEYRQLGETKGFFQDTLRGKYAGIIVMLQSADSKNTSFFSWLQKQIAAKIPVVFINNFAVPPDSGLLSQLNLLLYPAKASKTALKISRMNREMMGFEIQALTMPYDFLALRASGSQILLQMQNDRDQIEDAAAITPWGGYVLSPYFILRLPNFQGFWVINPFTFFHRALRLRDFPIPDTTTENGRRLMSVHIDGHGFDAPVKALGGSIAAVELRDQILKKFPIPTSVSLVTGEIAPKGINPKTSKTLMQIAKSIFALPWVESASNSFSHPWFWQAVSDKQQRKATKDYSLKIPDYHFNLASEITGSVDFINRNLAPENKPCRLFFWSGMANPSEEALALAEQNHLSSINGAGNTRISEKNPSLTAVQPMGMAFGGYYQVFNPLGKDIEYNDNYAGPLYGYEGVIQSLKMTDKPRRLKPIDLYYQMYSLTWPASLQTIIKVYRWALDQSVMNIFVSEYIKKVLDNQKIGITQNRGAWIIDSQGELRELRSLNSAGYPDLGQSVNVIGFKKNEKDMYIHLGPEQQSKLKYQKEKPGEVYLVEANASVTSHFRDKNRFILRFKGHMPLQFTLDNVALCKVTSQNPLKLIHNQDKSITYSADKESDEIRVNC